ncbi:MAG: hypothetical protein LBC35_00400, partial [Coriobacteriales bacterium]|nr:hypothetical protein [Coriobacteriales bacterium]
MSTPQVPGADTLLSKARHVLVTGMLSCATEWLCYTDPMLQVRPKMLIVAAAVVWLIAGVSVVSVGMAASTTPWTFP